MMSDLACICILSIIIRISTQYFILKNNVVIFKYDCYFKEISLYNFCNTIFSHTLLLTFIFYQGISSHV